MLKHAISANNITSKEIKSFLTCNIWSIFKQSLIVAFSNQDLFKVHMLHLIVSLVLLEQSSWFFFTQTFFFFFVVHLSVSLSVCHCLSQKYLSCKSSLYALPTWIRTDWNHHLLPLSKSLNTEDMFLDGQLRGLLHCLC